MDITITIADDKISLIKELVLYKNKDLDISTNTKAKIWLKKLLENKLKDYLKDIKVSKRKNELLSDIESEGDVI